MPDNLPPLNALKAFEAAGRHLNFRLAAEDLGVTQGAVAQHIRALEARLSIKLFQRLPRGLALTDVGRKYHAAIRRAFEAMQKATAEILPEQTVVTISVPPSFASMWLVQRLGLFTDAFPGVSVRVDASKNLANFQNDGIDIAVRQGKPPFGPGLVHELLFPMKLQAVCSPVLTASYDIESPADLVDQVLLHDAHGLWPAFLEKLTHETVLPNAKSLNFSQTSLAVETAMAGQGIALASDFLVGDAINAGQLVSLFECSFEDELSYYIVYPRRPHNADMVQCMRDWLMETGTRDSA